MGDNSKSLILNDFAGGWVTVNGALSLASNQCSDILNLIPLPGRLRFRGGYQNKALQPFPADHAIPFYDKDHGKHYAIWAGGNLYDAVSGVYVLIAAAVYTPGNRVGACVLDGVLYWSCGKPNPVKLQFWSPSAGTHGPVVNAGGVGYIDPPASNFLFTYLNCIMALAPTWGSPAGPDVFQPTLMVWCDVDRPDKWFGANGQAVGSNDGGELVFGMQFGIANTGVSPSRQIIVGRSDIGIYSYSGAMPNLEENVLNCPVGCRDADTVQYLPMTGLFGSIYFLGTDGQFWQLNGINAAPVSTNITDTIVNAVNNALAANPDLRFNSGYNEEWQYYWCDVNGTQFAFRWQTGAWTKFQGWPSGPTFLTTGFNGAPAYFVASKSEANPYLSQIAIDNVADNGVMPVVYYETAALHAGDQRLMKEWQWATIGVYDTGAKYAVSGKGNKRIDGSYMQSDEMMFTAPGADTIVQGQFILGQSKLGGPDVLGIGTTATGGEPTIVNGVFRCPVKPDEWMPEGQYETLKSNACKIKVRYAGGSSSFELLTIEVQYVPLGYYRGAGNQYNPTAGAPDGFDPFVGPL